MPNGWVGSGLRFPPIDTPFGPVTVPFPTFDPKTPRAPTFPPFPEPDIPDHSCPPGWPCQPVIPSEPLAPFPTNTPNVPPFNPVPSDCIWPWVRDVATDRCVLKVGPTVGPTPELSPNGAHRGDHVPAVIGRNVRVCAPGFVLGKDGFCHNDIPNKKRAYPKPRKALGTPGELNAVQTAKVFSARVVRNQKSLKQTARNFAKAGAMKLGR